MTFMWRVGIASLLPAAVSAADLCRDSKTTLQASGRKRPSDPGGIRKSPNGMGSVPRRPLWRDLSFWAQGSVRGAMAGYCLLKQTRRRTYDLWDAYVTYVDTTPPILPEPKLSENDK